MRPPHQFRHTPHQVRGPIGSSTEGPSATARMRSPHTDIGTPLTRLVASYGALGDWRASRGLRAALRPQLRTLGCAAKRDE
eukprot:4068329-Pyramimonas_sp.AAC.1